MRNWADYEEAVACLATDTGKAVRRWGFEIESTQIAETITYYGRVSGLEFVYDSSVTCPNCECDCRECSYHECNCENCDDYNDDPDHCYGCQANELSCATPLTVAKIPETFRGFIGALSARWVEASDYGEDWGGHIHIEARDLDKEQIRRAVIIGEQMLELSPEWFTGDPDGYNHKQDRYILDQLVKGQVTPRDTGRNKWISCYNLTGNPEPYNFGDEYDHRKTTIEFRRFRSTPDLALIEFRAKVARAVIQYAKSPTPIYWATRCRTFSEILEALQVESH